MNDTDPETPDEADRMVVDQLRAESPRPSPALRRRVRDRLSLAFFHRTLRRRAVVMIATGVPLLALALALALTAPR